MIEMRLLTDEAKRTRFDFVWTVEGCKVPIMAVWEGEHNLRLALESMLYKWQFSLGRGMR